MLFNIVLIREPLHGQYGVGVTFEIKTLFMKSKHHFCSIRHGINKSNFDNRILQIQQHVLILYEQSQLSKIDYL